MINRLNNNNIVITKDNEIIFISYESIIVSIKNKVLTLGRDWDYSYTNLKYFYKFLNTYCNIEEINNALNKSKNERNTIQQLIDNNIIKYNENL